MIIDTSYLFDSVKEFNSFLPSEKVNDLILRSKLLKEEFEEVKERIESPTTRAELCKEICDLLYVTVGGWLTVNGTASSQAVLNHTNNGADFLSAVSRAVDKFKIEKSGIALHRIYYGTLCFALNVMNQNEMKQAFLEVHRSNLSKVKGKQNFDENGKVLKGKGYKKADLSFLNPKTIIEDNNK